MCAATLPSGPRMARSPASDVLEAGQDMVEMTGLLNMKSPLSVLASDLHANLFVLGSKEVKTPRKCLLQDLEIASFENPSPVTRIEPKKMDLQASSPGIFAEPVSKFSSNTYRQSQALSSPFSSSPTVSPCRTSPVSLLFPLGFSSQVEQEKKREKDTANIMEETVTKPSKRSDRMAPTMSLFDKPPAKPFLQKSMSLNVSTSEALFQRPNKTISHWNQRKKQPVVPLRIKTQSTTCVIRKRDHDQTIPEQQKAQSAAPTMMEIDENVVTASFRMNSADTICQPLKMRRALSAMGPSLFSNPFSSPTTCPEPSLPSFVEAGGDMLRRINCETLKKLLSGEFSATIDTYHIIDCRFPYEYEGGHIQSAQNINDTEELDRLFFTQAPSKKVAIIFHCEYSIKRAPQMAHHFRSKDRRVNQLQYPQLHYPDMYILKGGYRDFYSQHKEYCSPDGYTEMTDPSFAENLKQGMMNLKRQFKRAL